MRIKDKKSCYVKRKIIIEDTEGGKYPGYSQLAIDLRANIYPATGKLQAEIYGEKLNYMLNMLYDGPVELAEGDGVCVFVSKDSKPDYKVISIKRYSHKVIELEKI